MVSSSDNIPSRLLLSGEFPPDRAAPPAFVTVPLSWLYRAGVSLHQIIRSVHGTYRPSVPVVSIGNITVGGTGKTPCVIALLRWIMEHYPQLAAPNAVAVLSRGYGRDARNLVVVEPDSDYLRAGDEPLLIKREMPQAAVVVFANRAQAARHAVGILGVKLLILDDGFQHRAVARDLDLVVLDPKSPFGNGHLLPAGPLREPSRALLRADGFVLVGIDSANHQNRDNLIPKPTIHFEPELTLPRELSTNLSTPVWLLTAIARPNRLYNQLVSMKINIVGHSVFRDHYRFTDADLLKCADEAKRSGAKLVLTTQKDRIRISRWLAEVPLVVAEYRLIVRNPDILHKLMEPIVGRAVA
jgi:tetraacyldisaccharide 4'-kinase